MSDFEDIRPYHDHEVSDALSQLVSDRELTDFVAGWLNPLLFKLAPGLSSGLVAWFLKRKSKDVSDIASFQDLIAEYARKLVAEGTTEFIYEGFEDLKADRAYLFVSNHRDIAGDSMLLDYALYLNDLDTVRIAIGDNLIQREFATSLMRLNKGFFIKRSVEGPRKAYAALLQSSEYIRHSIETGHSVWIAQREGRSKDGLDSTDPALIKMLALADRKKPLGDIMRNLHLVPLAISYEFDPCDIMKAKELSSIARNGCYEKPPGEDLLSLVTGLNGQKGKVVLRLGQELNADFESVDQVAAEIDRQIISNLELFPVNYWALSKVPEPEYQALAAANASQLDRKTELALTNRLRHCPPADRPWWLRMYANPVLNRHKVLSQTG